MKQFLVVFGAVLLASFIAMAFYVAKLPNQTVDSIEGFLGAGLPDVGQVFSTVASAQKEATIKADSTRLFACKVYREDATGTDAYFQLFNRATDPNFDSTPVFSFNIPASNSAGANHLDLSNTFFSPAARFSTGLAFGISSLAATYSSASINEANYDVNCIFE